MRSDDIADILSPQEWRVWCVLRDGKAHGIDTLHRQAVPNAPAEMSRRRRQMRIGAIIVRINRVLIEEGWSSRIVPGVPRHTYQLRCQ